MLHGLPALVRDYPGGGAHARHRHRAGYLSITLQGEEVEAGDEGRSRVGPGGMLVHRPFDAHCNYVGRATMKVLCLPLPAGFEGPSSGRLDDADAIARLAERDALAASAAALRAMIPAAGGFEDWPDLLAAHLRGPDTLPLNVWADRMGLVPETLSRGFGKLYGITPARYRLECRTRRALRRIAEGADPLADIATACGFADQAHMGRAVRALTGHPPSIWRRRESIYFKTVGAGSP